MDAMNNTLEYYNQNSEAFYSGTVNADMSELYAHFEPLLPAGASILDLGCGSGRDSKAFIDLGYHVTAIDGSEEFCRSASEYLGINGPCMRFDEISYDNEFDAVWACASLLHVPKDEIHSILQKAHHKL